MLLQIVLLTLIGVGALILCFQDCSKQQVSLFFFLLFISTTSLLALINSDIQLNLQLFNPTSVSFFTVMKIVLIPIFLLILALFYKKHAIAIADIILIILVLVIFNITQALQILFFSSLIGIIYSLITKKQHIGYVGILSLIIAISIIISNI